MGVPGEKSWLEVWIGAAAALLGAFFLYLFFACGMFSSTLDFAGSGTGTLLLTLGPASCFSGCLPPQQAAWN